MNKNKNLAIRIAKDVDRLGGTVYYVGGCVRDNIIGMENKDIDIEVFGISPEQLKLICGKYGYVDEIGESFGILKIHGFEIDVSMPRTERKNGAGHKHFNVLVDPFLSVEDAARRRDFTINAIMENVLTGEYTDPFSGISDLKRNLLRHINDDTFVEDPLRVFRAAQFAARFQMEISEDTIVLCKTIDTSMLSKERVFEETNKALLRSKSPSIYFKTLRSMNQLTNFFPILYKMIGVSQNLEWHPEGDVWNHTMEVLDKAAILKPKSSYWLGFMYATLFHDIGKIYCTTVDECGSVHAYNHETIGSEKVCEAFDPLAYHNQLRDYVENMIQNHMKPHHINNRTSMKSLNRYFDKCISPNDSILLSIADTINEWEIFRFKDGWWNEKLKTYEEVKSRPEVTGKDLIELGYEPEPIFTDILKKCHEIHLSGIKKDDVLRQIPSIIKGIKSRRKS